MESGYILSSGPVHSCCQPILEPYGHIVVSPSPAEADILTLIPKARAYIVRGDGLATKKIIEAGVQLQVIGRTGVGYETVDLQAARDRGIPVVNTPAVNAKSVAEGALAFMFHAAKHLGYYRDELLKGNWESRYQRKPFEIAGSTVGIVGFGAIGKELATLVHALGAQVLYHDPFVPEEIGATYHARKVDLSTLFSQSNFISLHTALTDQTRNMVNREALSLMKPGACLINLARGAVVESLDLLYEYLLDGRLGAVGLDVFHQEPPDTNHPIFSHPDCIATPHVVGMTDAAVERSFTMLAQDFERVFRGLEPLHRVDTL